MHNFSVGKRDFIQRTSKYLKQAEEDSVIIITHNNVPVLKLSKIKSRQVASLQGLLEFVEVEGDINDPVLPGYDQWS